MPVTLYHAPISPPSRSALLTLRAVGIDVDVKIVNLFENEQLKEEFIKMNPQHCVPTLDDNGFILWETKAISAYIVSKYGKDDTLYPKDLQKRAAVDRLLYFDATTLFPRARAIAFPAMVFGEKTVSQEKKVNLTEALSFLNVFLEGNKWVAGSDNYTIADIAIYISITGIVSFGWDISKYPRMEQWLKDCEIIPGSQESLQGTAIFGNAVKSNLNPGEI